MATSKPQSIRESARALHELERRHYGTPVAPRIRLLQLRKKDPSMTFPVLAVAIGIPVSTLKRWWSLYCREGLGALLAMRGSSHIHDDLQAPGIHTHDDAAGPAPSESLIRLLNMLPAATDVNDWIDQAHAFLRRLFSDIDRVVIAPNLMCNLEHPDDYDPDIAVTEITATDISSDEGISTTLTDERYHSRRLYTKLESQGIDWSRYHTPESFVYYYHGAYLGTVFLLCELHNPPISAATLESMRQLRPFMEAALSDCVARCRQERPLLTAFNRAFKEFGLAYELTTSQRRVLFHRFTGMDMDQTAVKMNIATNTVKSHMRSIQQKTGTGSLAELFVLCFSPLIKLLPPP